MLEYLRYLTIVGSALALAGCGGGGGGGNVNTVSAAPLKVFSDDAGVVKATDSSDNQVLYYLGPDATDFAAGVESGGDAGDARFSDFPQTSTTTYAKLRSGTFSVGSTTANVTVFEDNAGDAGIFYFEIPSVANFVMTTGEPLGTLPTTQLSYKGTFLAARRGVFSSNEAGTFTMTADFPNDVLSINGSTTNFALAGSNVSIANDGSFASTSTTFTTGGNNSAATLYGSFHGTSGGSVSGVFHTNESNPTYAGAFAGAQR